MGEPRGDRRRLVHVLDGDFASGYFPDLARFADGDRYEVVFTSIEPLPEDRAALLARPGVSSYCGIAGNSRGAGAIGRGRWALETVGRLERLLARLRPDVVHAHLYEPALLGTTSATVRRVPVRVVGRHHSDLLHRAGRPLHVRADRLATRLSHAVITNSEFTRRVMLEREGATPEKVRVVYYGLDTQALTSAPDAALDALRRELRITGDRLVVVVPARLDREKGQEYLFEALAGLARDGIGPFTVLLAGDGPARELFERRVRELGLGGSVRFLGHRRDIYLLYQVADLTVLPSLSEAFGQVLIESLCFGTGVVATRVGGIPEIVEDGRTGLLVEPAEPRDLARALRESAEHPGRREEMAAAGRARVREVFDSRRTARDNEAVYDELLARAGRL
jgi:glycosyltransferase involved in cell wall biosynthesis